MPRTLDVYLYADLAGHLRQDDAGDMSFQYAQSWLQQPGAVPLSQSLPLRLERFRRKECRGFFAGILEHRLQAIVEGDEDAGAVFNPVRQILAFREM